MLRSVCGPHAEEIMEGLKKSHNEELHAMYYLPNIIRVSKSRRM
jgi:predicted adenine nucleotide alpha hydrolase (AANH) superfamily ATPase